MLQQRELQQAVADMHRIAIALEALVNIAEWYTSGDTTTLDALACKQDEAERRIAALEGEKCETSAG